MVRPFLLLMVLFMGIGFIACEPLEQAGEAVDNFFADDGAAEKIEEGLGVAGSAGVPFAGPASIGLSLVGGLWAAIRRGNSQKRKKESTYIAVGEIQKLIQNARTYARDGMTGDEVRALVDDLATSSRATVKAVHSAANVYYDVKAEVKALKKKGVVATA